MKGKYLILQCRPGDSGICSLCNSFAPLAADESELLSFQLEKRLFKNGMLECRADGFGICFDRQRGINQWQIVCRSCLHYDGDEQDVIDSCFRIKFHVDNGNLKSASDLENLFTGAPNLAMKVMKDIRNDWISLNRAYTLDMKFFERKLMRKFYFNSTESRIFLGLDLSEFEFIYVNYLRPFAGRYEVYDAKEIFGCLMLMLRTGQPLSFIHSMLTKFTDHYMSINSLSKSIRKTLYYLGKFNII